MLILVVSVVGILFIFQKSVILGLADTRREESRFRLFKLRDKLRSVAISEKAVSKEKWFDFLDTSITTTIAFVEDVTIWKIIEIGLVYKRDPKIERAHQELELELHKNPEFREFYNLYTREFFTTLKNRHRFLFSFCKFVLGVVSRLSVLREQMQRALVGAPETSTLLRFYGRTA